MADGLAEADAAAYVGAADVKQFGGGEGNVGRQTAGREGRTTARIDNYAVMGYDFLVGEPAVEARPVVSSNEQGEVSLRIVGGQRLQRVPCI